MLCARTINWTQVHQQGRLRVWICQQSLYQRGTFPSFFKRCTYIQPITYCYIGWAILAPIKCKSDPILIFYYYLYHAGSCGNAHAQTPSRLELEVLYSLRPLDPTLQEQQSIEWQQGGWRYHCNTIQQITFVNPSDHINPSRDTLKYIPVYPTCSRVQPQAYTFSVCSTFITAVLYTLVSYMFFECLNFHTCSENVYWRGSMPSFSAKLRQKKL